ncbi:matrix metalloproteinase-2 [Apis florea]|uniref:matrix metalloproteinase-2 n=1 Tax=Apis florea TaxID=7463 RepID=UPI000629B64D|nr:matrix metalloproteinase-2 [Apis florea]
MKFGYLPQSDLETGNLRTDDQLTDAIKNLQRFGGIPVTGDIDEATMKLMRLPRCGLPDKIDPRYTRVRHKRYTIHGQQWPHRNLTWSKLAIPSSRLAPKRRLGGEFEADRSSQLTTHYFMTGDDLRC